MATGYDSNDINTTTAKGRKNFVRLLTGDTLSSDFLLDDNEIAVFLLGAGDDVSRAAVSCAKAIAAQFSRKADISIGKARVAASKRADQYWKLAYELERNDLPTIKAGGFSEDEREAIREDEDVLQPHFTAGMHDLPGSASAQNVNDDRPDGDDC